MWGSQRLLRRLLLRRLLLLRLRTNLLLKEAPTGSPPFLFPDFSAEKAQEE
jgi:hypothetical protein